MHFLAFSCAPTSTPCPPCLSTACVALFLLSPHLHHLTSTAPSLSASTVEPHASSTSPWSLSLVSRLILPPFTDLQFLYRDSPTSDGPFLLNFFKHLSIDAAQDTAGSHSLHYSHTITTTKRLIVYFVRSSDSPGAFLNHRTTPLPRNEPFDSHFVTSQVDRASTPSQQSFCC